MMHGLPVIASNIGGREELIDVGRTGLLFQVGSAQQLASHMRTLWNDPARCRAMGQAGRELASRRFGEDLYFENLMAIYRQAIGLVDGPSPERQPPAEVIEHVSI
jgi:glycosyltransferase involved in cell wall biosynthesis